MKKLLYYLILVTGALLSRLPLLAQTIPDPGDVPDADEYDALTALYDATNGAVWDQATDWKTGTTNDSYGRWYGITVENGDVTAISLPQNMLAGSLPAELGLLKKLRTLDLNNNQLTGSLPPELTALPELETLDLSNNDLSGTLPDMSGTNRLRSLNLYFNKFTGPFPVSLRPLKYLNYLNLGYNHLSGMLPAVLGEMTGLTSLNLQGNAFSGKVPQQLDNLTNLEELFLNNNQFNELPYLAGLSDQLTFWISNNQLDLYDLDAYFTGINTTRFTAFQYAPQAPPRRTEVVACAAGGAVTLSVALGGSRFRYRWQKLVGNTWTYITAAPAQFGHNYHISAATPADAGLYRCMVSHTWATQVTHPSKEILLKVKENQQPVKIPDQPSADQGLHWVTKKTYDGDEKVIAESRLFLDGFGRTIQTQAKNFTAGQVLATQTLYDLRGAPALTTLPAPINNQSFSYKPDFITSAQGAAYGTANFDQAKTDNPDPVGHTAQGTLGWYYGPDNTADETVAQTAYPYSRTESYPGPAGMVSRVTLPGDEHKPGSGREAYTGVFPVLDELAHYLSLRHYFVPTAPGAALRLKAAKQVSRDPLGKETVTFTDQNGHVIASCLTGESYTGTELKAVINSDPAAGAPPYMDLHLTAGAGTNVPVTIIGGGAINILDLGRDLSWAGPGTAYTGLTPGTPRVINLAPGFYRVTSVSQNQEVSYTAYYGNFRYNYYDDAGRLVAAVDPKGVDPGSAAQPDYTTTYRYDAQNNLLRTESPDAGTSEFVYRQDGRLRFSQSAQQQQDGKFSYTHYDRAGRVTEAGEYVMGGGSWQFESQLTAAGTPAANSVLHPDILENTEAGGGLDAGRCSQVTYTLYDEPDPNYGGGQRFVLGRVSSTHNDNDYSWYSYDAQGRLERLVTKNGLGDKTIDYTYDFNGNLLAAIYQKGNFDEQFWHRYSYDADQRLRRVETSRNGEDWEPQAAYSYYLHGPLKRTELGDQLQGLDYTYTVQGWLKGINHGTSAYDPGEDGQSNNVRPDLFGLTLEYFNGDYVSRGQPAGTFTVAGSGDDGPRYDGLVKAASWHTLGQQPKAYAYRYDAQNRFVQADYGFLSGQMGSRQFIADAKPAFREQALGYDAQSNLSGLQRTDAFGTTQADYGYEYEGGTSRLASVQQGGLKVQQSEYNADGELVRQTAGAAEQHFDYDATGRVLAVYRDAGKTLPAVEFRYNERGSRQQKLTYDADGNPALVTWYITDAGGNVVSTYEEQPGRAAEQVELPVYGAGRLGMWRRSPEGRWSYDYELQDNLGSTRVVFRSLARRTEAESLEDGTRSRQSGGKSTGFERVAETRHLDAARARTGQYSALLSTARGTGLGPGQTLAVRKGDSIMAEVYGYFIRPRKGRWLPFTLAPLAGLFGKTKAQEGGLTNVGLGLRLVPAAAGAAGVLATRGTPDAYLQLSIYDADSMLVRTEEVYLSDSAALGYEQLATEYRVEEDGYVRVEVKNDDPGDVYFDDLRIAFSGLQVLEENHLYPYGKQQQEISYVIDGAGPYRHGFQGEFAEKDGETKLTNFDLRMYSGEIGRWLAPDPYGQYSSPYVGMGANPVNSIDPDGGWSLLGAFGGAVIGGAIGGGISAATGGDFWEGAAYGAVAGFAAGGIFGPDVKWQGSNAGANHTLQMKLTWNTPNFSGVSSFFSNAGNTIAANAGPIASAAGNAGLQLGLNGGHGAAFVDPSFRQWEWPTVDRGGVIDNWPQFYSFMVSMANNASPCKEVAAFEVKVQNRRQPIYIVQPWLENTHRQSINKRQFVMQFGFRIDDIIQQYHSHPFSSKPSAEDERRSKDYGIKINAIGADGLIRTVDPFGKYTGPTIR